MDDLERLLQNYRVADPPEGLRERIVDASMMPHRASLREWLWPLGAAAAALIFYALADRQRLEFARQIDSGRSAAVAGLAERLGGDATAKQAAEQLVYEDEAAGHREIARYAAPESAPHD